jgi:parvulin-like peptidyl-prolyl isomerase
MLYKVQMTGDFFYGTTRIVPLPVASVDGQNVPYSDYLRRIRADIFYYENHESRNFKTDDGKRELEYNKRQELNAAERTAYAVKLAKQLNISVSDKEVNDLIDKQLKADGNTEANLERTLRTYTNWSLDEYRQEIRNQLLEQKVAFAVDTAAKSRADGVLKRVQNGEDFAAIAQEMSDDLETKSTGGVVVARTGELDSIGLIAAARGLEPGQISGLISGRDVGGEYAYFIVKLNSKSDNETNYSVIRLNVTQFNKDFADLQKQGKIREFIRVPSDEEINSSQG